MRGATVAVLCLCTLGLVVGQTSDGGWQQGRATYYGGSAQFLKNFPGRGPPPEYGFGTPLYGSCGYTSQQGTGGVDFSDVPIPVDTIAAVANINQDYPGSCGRCYEVRCETGVVTANFSSSGARIPYNISNGYIEPGLNYATLEDDYQRTYAGNPLMSQNMLFTQCYNNTLGLTTAANSIYVRVADNCPCVQYDADTGAETGVNAPCCGNVNHFDLSYFAFEKIAHPAYGLMNLEFRPVDCTTKQPLIFLPGYINETIYSDQMESGWSWNAYQTTNKQLEVSGAGVGGQNATCVDTNAKGGLTFVSREATDSGYQPFIAGNATTVSFYVKQTAHGASNIGAASGATIPSNVQLGLGDDETQYYCQGMDLNSLTKGTYDQQSQMQQLTMSLSSFNCDLSRVQQVGFQNVGSSPVAFCLSQLALTGGSPPSHVLQGVSASAQGDYPGPVTPLTSTAST